MFCIAPFWISSCFAHTRTLQRAILRSGSDVDAALGKLVTEMGLKQAGSIQCLCWALLWGKTTGNSINHARNKIRKMQLTSITSLDIFLLFEKPEWWPF